MITSLRDTEAMLANSQINQQKQIVEQEKRHLLELEDYLYALLHDDIKLERSNRYYEHCLDVKASES